MHRPRNLRVQERIIEALEMYSRAQLWLEWVVVVSLCVVEWGPKDTHGGDAYLWSIGDKPRGPVVSTSNSTYNFDYRHYNNQWMGRTDHYLQMYRLEFKTSGGRIDCFRGIYRAYLRLIKENRKIVICDWLNLEIIGLWSIMPPKKIPRHCIRRLGIVSFN